MVIRTSVVVCWAVVFGALGCGQDSPTAPTPPTTPPAPGANRSPTASGSIPDQRLTVGGSAVSVDVAPYFTDPDGDALTYSAMSSDVGVATAGVSGSIVTVTPAAAGTAAVTVTARDPGGLTATGSMAVTVASGPSSDDHADTRGGATPVASNSSTGGTLEPGDVDYFRLDVAARTTLTAESTGTTDTVGQLEDAGGSVLATDDDGAGVMANFRISREVPAGTYYIQVRGFSSEVAGPYTLVVSSTETPSGAPDLVVESPSVSSASVEPAESFTLSATVRNQGAADAASTSLTFYRSTDSTISDSDTSLGSQPVSGLAANRTESKSTTVLAPTSPGTYYHGACVRAVGGETDTGNNCSAGVRVVVTSPPGDDHGDTRAAATPVGSNSSTPGTLEPGDTDYFRLDLSSRTTLTVETTGTTDTVGQLEDGGGSVLASNDDTVGANFRIVRDVSAGTYYVRVRAFGRTDAGPYTLVVSSTETPSGAPDLVVESPSVSSASVEPSESFTLSATVRNQGAADAASTSLTFYRSTDSTISDSDTSLGSQPVSGLAANRTESKSTTVLAPTSPGTYYHGACVRAVGGETDTGNNCSAGVRVVVTSPPGDDHGDTRAAATPVGSNSSTPGTLEPGDTDYFRLDLSSRTTLTVETTGTTDTVGQLEDGGGSVLASNDDSVGANFRIVRDVSAGTYYVRVRAFGRTDAGPYTLVVSSRQTPSEVPDLVVESPEVSSSRVAGGESLTLSATVRNRGAAAAAATTLRYYRSSDRTVTTGDTAVGTGAVPSLAAGENSPRSIGLRAPSSRGFYYYGACVDPVGREADTGNNCSRGVLVQVGSSSDDHGDTLATATPVALNSRTAGQLEEEDVDYFRVDLSAQTTLVVETTGNVNTVGRLEDSRGSLVASDTSTGSGSNFRIRRNVPAGTYYIKVAGLLIIDTGPYTLVVSSAATPSEAPDLVVESPAVSSSEVHSFGTFRVSATVRNRGAGVAESTRLRYYSSPDADISREDNELLFSAEVPELEPNETSTRSRSTRVSKAAGTYYYGACVDPVVGESDTSNNCSTGVPVVVPEGPDLVAAELTVWLILSPRSLTMSVRVLNQGADPSASTTLRYYRSVHDAISTTHDTEVGTRGVPGIMARRTTTVALNFVPSTGTYYYYACIDPVREESDTGNNCTRLHEHTGR